MEVFVYGTLKPKESNYSAYCAGKVINSKTAYTKGHLSKIWVKTQSFYDGFS